MCIFVINNLSSVVIWLRMLNLSGSTVVANLGRPSEVSNFIEMLLEK